MTLEINQESTSAERRVRLRENLGRLSVANGRLSSFLNGAEEFGDISCCPLLSPVKVKLVCSLSANSRGSLLLILFDCADKTSLVVPDEPCIGKIKYNSMRNPGQLEIYSTN